MQRLTVLGKKNDWLLDYRGKTFTDRLQEKIHRAVFKEHAKYKSGNKNFSEQFGKKAVVVCVDPNSKELLSVGASSLLKDERTGQIMDNVILDNFGLFFAALMSNGYTASTSAVLIDDANTSQTFNILSTSVFFNDTNRGIQIKMGSGSTTPLRNDYKIQTALGSSPESGYLNINAGAYTAQNTVVYQGDANPTGGSGTVNEIGSFGKWQAVGPATKVVMLTHDAVTPAVTYATGKLLRGAYSWQL